MKLSKITFAVVVAIATFSFLDSSMAKTTTSQADGRWQDSGTWDNGVPADGDTVILAETYTVTVEVATAEVDSITIRDSNTDGSQGMLHLKSGSTLKIRSSIVVEDDLTYAGEFDSVDSSGTTPVVQASHDTTAGTVSLDGQFQCQQHLGIRYTAESTDGFHLQSGSMSSSGGKTTISTSFENDAVVNANGSSAGYDIEFDSSSTINNGSVGTFEVTASNAKLIFNHDDSTAPILSGDSDFNVELGQIQFQSSLATAGGLQMTGGSMQISAGKTAQFDGAY